MGIFKRTPKRFEYKPRYYKGEGNPFEIKHKFDEFRTTTQKKNLKGKFVDAVEDFKKKDSEGTGKKIFIIAAILVFIFLYLIDFDISIFLKK